MKGIIMHQELHHRLKIARESLFKKQDEMAELLGIGLKSWQVYEQGKSVPGGKVIESLVKLGFNANWLLTGEGDMLMTENTTETVNHAYAMADTLKNSDLTAEELVHSARNIAISAGDDLTADLVIKLVRSMTAGRTKTQVAEIDAALLVAVAETMKKQDQEGSK